jgi:hypothetical protein
MAEPLYYYSSDGTEALGPVGTDVLRRLASEGTLREGSLICPVGGSEWQPFDLAALPKAQKARPARPRTAKRPAVEDDRSGEQGLVAQILNVVAVLAGGSCVVVILSISGLRAQENGTVVNGWYVLGGSLLVFVMIPWWISLLFKGQKRVIVRTAIMLGLAIALRLFFALTSLLH